MAERRILLIKKTSNTIPNNEIWYTSSDGNIVTPYRSNVFGSSIISNIYNNGKGVIKFETDVTIIGYQAFLDCNKLTSIIIPNNVTLIEHYVFQYCVSLISVIIPNNVRSIGNQTFDTCSSLNSITIPNSVINIGGWAFRSCTTLTSIIFEGTVEEWNNINIGDNWDLDSAIKTIHCTNGDIQL